MARQAQRAITEPRPRTSANASPLTRTLGHARSETAAHESHISDLRRQPALLAQSAAAARPARAAVTRRRRGRLRPTSRASCRSPGARSLSLPTSKASPDCCGRYLMVVMPIGALAVLIGMVGRTRDRALRHRAAAERRRSALHRIGAGDFTPQPLPAGDGRPARSHRGVQRGRASLDRGDAQRDRNESQMRQFIADAGHELRTPLTVVMGYLEVLQQASFRIPAGVAHDLRDDARREPQDARRHREVHRAGAAGTSGRAAHRTNRHRRAGTARSRTRWNR